ncbi:MAG TPA: hypothetical protein VGG39_36905 [Polyangiaceae bacterium]|jgi:hypothetical protein
MDERRAYLKQLAARSARTWSSTPLPSCFAGETRIETRNTLYELRDGVCYAVKRQQGAGTGKRHPSEFIGMRVVGWLMRDAPMQGITLEWQPGAYAVLWRPREAGEEHSAVALTSTTHAFQGVLRPSLPPAPLLPTTAGGRGGGRVSTPPPLPLAVLRSALLPRPVTPSPWVPAAPETPTPPRRSSVPPPLPPAAFGLCAPASRFVN